MGLEGHLGIVEDSKDYRRFYAREGEPFNVRLEWMLDSRLSGMRRVTKDLCREVVNVLQESQGSRE